MIPIVLAIVVLIYFGMCAGLYFFQRSLIYLPQRRPIGGGAAFMLQSAGESLQVSTRPHEGPKAVIYFGGNAEDVSLNLPGLSESFPEHAIYLLHYRGYGRSSGKPSEEALFADGLALFDEVNTRHQHIVVIGRSLGSGVAVYLASHRSAARLVLVTPYDGLQELAAREYPFFPVRWLLKDKYESWRYAPRVTSHTLIVVAEQDEVIPRASSDLLLSRFSGGVATLTVIAGTYHNNISASPEYLPLLAGTGHAPHP